nr:Chain A, VIRAL MACROPHAGE INFLAMMATORY PROTEIN-II [Human gammaherpesvirus 8]
LGASWHRPDK